MITTLRQTSPVLDRARPVIGAGGVAAADRWATTIATPAAFGAMGDLGGVGGATGCATHDGTNGTTVRHLRTRST